MDTLRFLMFRRSFDKVLKDIKKKEMSYMSDYGLRAVHMGCLLRIKQSGRGMTVTELAKESQTDKALISRVIKELTSDGFVTTNGSGYHKRYFLTEESEKIVSDIAGDIGEYMAQARRDIPEEDMQKFYEVLATLTHNISLIANDE
ncbi:MAG: MarR family transcriptional regulator [Clostridia bacterium]|nr:MarR family transcriptional regulator [Clostridia bacterium]